MSGWSVMSEKEKGRRRGQVGTEIGKRERKSRPGEKNSEEKTKRSSDDEGTVEQEQ